LLFDTHCHLDVDRFPEGADAVLLRAHTAGVRAFVDVGVGGNERSRAAVELARRRTDVLASVGIDPHEAGSCDSERWNLIESLAAQPEVVAIGETGLDYFYDSSPKDLQQRAFARQIALAKSVDKPLIIHTRQAATDTIDILTAEHAEAVGGVFHCFTADTALARAALNLGFMVSFSGILTFNSDARLADAARFVPRDQLLVETDSPYLSPVPVRKQKPCEPAFVAHTADYLARLRDTPFDELCRLTTANALRLFRVASERFESDQLFG
jgi:TatD DNase family protein